MDKGLLKDFRSDHSGQSPLPVSPGGIDVELKRDIVKTCERAVIRLKQAQAKSDEDFQREIHNLRGIAHDNLRTMKAARKAAGSPVRPMVREDGYKTGILLLIFFISFVLIGMLWFCLVEEMEPVDAIYLIVIIVTTVGYGMNEELETQRLQLFLIFYVSFGACLIFTGIHFYFDRTLGRILFQTDPPATDDSDSKSDWDMRSEISSFMHDMYEQGELRFEVLILVWLTWLLGGAYFIADLEGWSFLEGTYFAVISGSTVGFGDFEPADVRTKLFVIFYLPPLIILTLFIFTHTFVLSVKGLVDETLHPHPSDTMHFYGGYSNSNTFRARESFAARSHLRAGATTPGMY